MTYVLDNADILPVPVIAEARRAAPEQPGLLARLRAAVIRSRMREAEREIRARHLLLNEAGIVLGGIPFTALSSDERLPFNR